VFRAKALLLGLFCCFVIASPAQGWYQGLGSPAESHSEARWRLPMDGPLGSPFGPRWGGTHDGIDIEGWYETRVRAAQTGRVVHVGWLSDYSGYGLVVKIRHEGGIVTMYAHLARAFVERGEIVATRQIIARAGCTGSCTGTHLHFQAWRHGKLIDPLELLGRRAFRGL
jgi:murein DD-endopeptidase MepM/ murein hydrolase activator NlpD